LKDENEENDIDCDGHDPGDHSERDVLVPPSAEVVVAGPEVAIVDEEVGLPPLLTQQHLLPHVPVVVQREPL